MTYMYLCEGDELEGMIFVDNLVPFHEAKERLARSLRKQGVKSFKIREATEDYEDWRN